MGGVSNPTNFSHAVHVGFDPSTGEFVGLPPEWSKLLNSSAITKEDYERNPQAVFEVLDFYSDLTKRAENPNQYPSLTPTPPRHRASGTSSWVTPAVPRWPPRPAAPIQRNPGSYTTPVGSQPEPPVWAAATFPTESQQQRMQMQNMAPTYVSDRSQELRARGGRSRPASTAAGDRGAEPP